MTTSPFIFMGVGGAGGKIVNAISQKSCVPLRAVAIDTDFAALAHLTHCQHVQLGATRFGGLGSGGDRNSASMAADEHPALGAVFEDASIAIIVASVSKGTGSGVLPKLLTKAAEQNVTTLVFLITPFAFEGTELARKAAEGEQLTAKLGDARFICKNDELCSNGIELTLEAAFEHATQTLAEGMLLLWKMTTFPGYINLDLATLINFIRSGRGTCYLGVGASSEANRTQLATQQLLDSGGTGIGSRIAETKAALVGIIGSDDLRLKEISETMDALRSAFPMDTRLHMSTVIDPALESSIHVVTILFKEWNTLFEHDAESDDQPESPTPTHAGKSYRYASSKTSGKKAKPSQQRTYNNKFQESAATWVDGINLDKPTFLRRKLQIDLS